MYNIIAVVVTIVLYMLYQKWSTRNIKMVTGTELESMLSKNKKGFQLIDVRTPEEYSQHHVKGFKNIPLDQIRSRLKEITSDKPVVVMCASGSRSIKACKVLSKVGMTDVINLRGGIAAYRG
ncbi:MAG: hypothetical protein PWP51_1121 [Clostridiales bacterium]|jgi:rhodanese-related sulfurtransferase|nr:hypothetical protein [Clostridiales bacterium]MDN5298568.1 hypothetical protein [Clostridiales bacterium]